MPAQEPGPWSATEKHLRTGLRSQVSGAAVATVTSVEGSAYRRPGAKMLVSETGAHRGAVTAGCLEPAVVDICTDVIDQGAAKTARFDLTDDEDGWGLGLGCNGVIDMLIEPRDRSWDRPLTTLSKREPVTVITVIESGTDTTVGDRVVIDNAGTHAVPDRNRIPPGVLTRVSDPVEAVGGTDATKMVAAGEATLLIDGFEPTPKLLLFGSQQDLQPVTRLGEQAGFRVTVHAQRGGVRSGTFPGADTVRTGHPTAVAESISGEYTYAVVMSHNFLDDTLAVETLLRETEIPYIGVMGPRERFDRMRKSISRSGTALSESEMDRIAAPIGLDIGGGEPVEVALSIVSEIIAVRNDCSGGRLRSQQGSIH